MITRFAPAPTGHLHLGHVVNAIYVWGIARAAGGRVLLRIEDHDRTRSRPDYERVILDDLDWLGFAPDEPSTDAFRAGVCEGRQRDRQPVYERALATLRAQGLVYVCGCSRREIAAAAGGNADDELRYPGTCAEKRWPERPGSALRVRLPATVERFVDGVHGELEQRPSVQCGDLLLRDRDGHWTYQFSVVADDSAQGITHVIRGDDLLASTGRQILLARILGREVPPMFVHHPLIMKSPTQKLSKADRDTSIRELRATGLAAPDLIGRAAYLVGLTDKLRPLGASELVRLPRMGELAARLTALEP